MSDAPEVIYLQWIPEKTWHDGKSPAFEVTWCEDEINDDDIEYVKASTATHLRGLLRLVESETRRIELPCVICGSHPLYDCEPHTEDCELAEELKGE